MSNMCLISYKYAVNVVRTIYSPSCPLWISKDVSRKASHLHIKKFKWVQTIWIYSQFKYISRVFVCFYVGPKCDRGMLSANINAMLFCVVCLSIKFKRNGDVKTKTFMFTTFYVWEWSDVKISYLQFYISQSSWKEEHSCSIETIRSVRILYLI